MRGNIVEEIARVREYSGEGIQFKKSFVSRTFSSVTES